MSLLTRAVVIAAILALPCSAVAQGKTHRSATADANSVRKMSSNAKIRSALSAAPAHIAAHAAVLAPDSAGTMQELRAGTNGWTCIPDEPTTPGRDPMCVDEQAMKWVQALMAHKDKPDNAAPGIAYMLAGGSDISATDPFATTTDNYIASPPHWMLLWAADSATSGLPTKPKKTGAWIMWAGTPYAHVMINGRP